MSKRNNGYKRIAQIKKDKQKANSSANPGKRTIYFTIGGRGLKFDQGTLSSGNKFWNPGNTRPSLRFK